MDWAQVIVAIIVDVSLTGILLYAFQSYLDERASKRLKRFDWLHRKQAELIADLYKKLVLSDTDLSSLSTSIKTEESFEEVRNKCEIAKKSMDYFWMYYRVNRIYFPDSLKQNVKDFYFRFMKNYFSVFTFFMHMDVYSELGVDHNSEEFDMDVLNNLLADMSTNLANDIPPVIDKLEQEFRKLLGS